MIRCAFKKTFLADLASVDVRTRHRIEHLVFETIPGLRNVTALLGSLDVRAMKGHPRFFRIRVGHYRIGLRIEGDYALTFYRVKHRKDIYRVFPN